MMIGFKKNVVFSSDDIKEGMEEYENPASFFSPEDEEVYARDLYREFVEKDWRVYQMGLGLGYDRDDANDEEDKQNEAYEYLL